MKGLISFQLLRTSDSIGFGATEEGDEEDQKKAKREGKRVSETDPHGWLWSSKYEAIKW